LLVVGAWWKREAVKGRNIAYVPPSTFCPFQKNPVTENIIVH
jgi:hypothetical protein